MVLVAHEVPKCLEDRTSTEFRHFSIKTSDGGNFLCTLNYCKKCGKYITGEGMEKDIKKVALEYINFINISFVNIPHPSYEISDIVEINRLK